MPLTTTDIKKIQAVVKTVVKSEVDPLKDDVRQIKKNVSSLTTSVDGLIKTVERHDQELIVLGAQHDTMKKILVKKGVATEDQLAIV